MLKIFQQMVIIIIALLALGCASLNFNPNVKKIVFVEGKPFRIPAYGATYITQAYKNKKNDRETIKYYRQHGLKLNIGDILWAETSVMKEINSIFKTSGKKATRDYLIQAIRRGQAGWSRPLSSREYNFYRGKEIEQSANQRAAIYHHAATAPRTINHNVNQNVNMNGTVNHNIQHSGYVNIYRQ